MKSRLLYIFFGFALVIGGAAFYLSDDQADTPESELMALYQQAPSPVPGAELFEIDENNWVSLEEGLADLEPAAGVVSLDLPMPDPIEGEAYEPLWQRHAVSYTATTDRPMIAIIIDDMGVDIKRSARASQLPGPLTLSYLPYASNLKKQTTVARQNGHELMVHMPMEAISMHVNPGPNALESRLDQAELKRRLEKNLNAFGGYVGINNHMGSKLTQDRQSLSIVMAELKERELLFVDSRTIHSSAAAEIAADYNVPVVDRDVFLDHYTHAAGVDVALKKLEAVAMREGYAVAIGHPKDITLAALETWIPAAKERGIQIVPISTVVKKLHARDVKAMLVSDEQ